MRYTPNDQAQIHQDIPGVVVHELGASDALDVAEIHIDGRYPENGFALNERSDFSVYVVSGQGKLVTKTGEALLQAGDAAFVDRGEAYYFEGTKLKTIMTCTPPWDPDQAQ